MKIKHSELNRLNKESLNERMLSIATDVAEALIPTYGPYGACTLIQSVDSVYSTKDGWTVLQNLTYGYNGVNNALKKLIQDCAQSVLLKVGDGTTTVTLLAQQIYKRVYETILSDKDTSYNAKELETTLKCVVDDICNKMMSSCNVITDDNMESTIRSIASCSTNWDEEMANYIVDIYKNTKNPIIKFENSGTENSYVKYTSGYDIKGELMLPDQYLTDRNSGECKIEKPAVIMFDYALKKEMLNIVAFIADMYANTEGRTLVVLAPDFQPDFINGLMSVNMTRVRAHKPYVSCVPFKYYVHGKTEKDCAEDLCILLGTDMISQANTDMAEMFSDVENAVAMKNNAMKDGSLSEEERQMYIDEERNTIMAAYEYLNTISGTCERITATDKYFLATGLNNANEKIINERKEKLMHEIDLETKEAAALSMITNKVRFKRIRLGKLQCNMGTIYVGGFGDANLKSKRDALDDATKACESAYRDGVIVGGGVAALRAIMELGQEALSEKELNSTRNTKLYVTLMNIIADSYVSVVSIMYQNKFGDRDADIDVRETIEKAARSNVGYNLITDEFDESLITPVNGEIEILKGCMSLVSVMICSNQLVFHDINSIEDADRVRAIDEAGDISVETAVKFAKESSN